VVYTDGVTEATNEAMEEYGLDRLITVCRRERESGDLAASVMADLGRFTGSEPIGDDRTLVVVRCLQR
jgi:sigma-B regulation protein RsbU (phosphoserine phosphatase)